MRYFGPFGHAKSLRSTLDLLLPTFPVRTCSDAKYVRHERRGRPCLLADIGRCSAPCVGLGRPPRPTTSTSRGSSGSSAATPRRSRATSRRACGPPPRPRTTRPPRGSATRSATSSAPRTPSRSCSRTATTSTRWGWRATSCRPASCASSCAAAASSGRESLRADLVDDLGDDELLERFLGDLYDAERPPPREVVVDHVGADVERLGAWLSTLRGGPGARRRARARPPARRRRARDGQRRRGPAPPRPAPRRRPQRALQVPRRAPGRPRPRARALPDRVLRHEPPPGDELRGLDGRLRRRPAREARLPALHGAGPSGATTTSARCARSSTGASATGATTPGGDRFGANPDLLVVDGGLGQLHAAVDAVEARGVTGELELASLAKRLEEVYRPGSSRPVVLPRTSEALYLLQRVRDEAHRFAISFHRSTRGRRMTASLLDGIEGLGPTRRERLLEAFGSVAGVRAASLDELRALTLAARRRGAARARPAGRRDRRRATMRDDGVRGRPPDRRGDVRARGARRPRRPSRTSAGS